MLNNLKETINIFIKNLKKYHIIIKFNLETGSCDRHNHWNARLLYQTSGIQLCSGKKH
jgi:hypothetical protein